MDDKKPIITLLSAFIIAASIIAGAFIIRAGSENTFQTCIKEAFTITEDNLAALHFCTSN